MNIAIDTNRYSDLCRNDPTSVRVVESADRVIIPFVVLGELRSGFGLGGHARRNEQALTRFLQLPQVVTVFADDSTTRIYATIFSELRRSGTPIPTNDIWIAAIVLQHDLVLFSRDRYFELIPRIARM